MQRTVQAAVRNGALVFLPGALLVSKGESATSGDQSPSKLVCRPSDLPVYTQPPLAPDCLEAQPRTDAEEAAATAGLIEERVAQLRGYLETACDEAKAYQRVSEEYLMQGKDSADWLLKYLRQEDNVMPKAGAIAIGGLAGLIFGLRGGRFRRVLYTTTGILGMSAVCYPKEAAHYSKLGITEAKKYATIAYNFAYGGGEAAPESQADKPKKEAK